jgi:hypothetical protein
MIQPDPQVTADKFLRLPRLFFPGVDVADPEADFGVYGPDADNTVVARGR